MYTPLPSDEFGDHSKFSLSGFFCDTRFLQVLGHECGWGWRREAAGQKITAYLIWLQLALAAETGSGQPHCLCGPRPWTELLLQVSLEYALFRCVDSSWKISKGTGNKRSHQGAWKPKISLPAFVRLRVCCSWLLHPFGECRWGGGGCVDWY